MRFPNLLVLLFAIGLIASAPAQSQTLTGTVTNKTSDKPAANDDVVLLKLAQGMQELARTKTDARGRFTLKVPAEETASLHLVRVTHDGANYFEPAPAGTQSVAVTVYSAQPEVAGISVAEDVLQIQTTPDGGTLRVVEHFLVRNDSQPQLTQFSDHPFDFYLPAGAKVDGASAKAPGGMAVEQPVVPLTDPDHYTLIFPIRPGETEFAVFYKVPYPASFTFQPRLTLPTDAIGIMLPRAMTFRQAAGTPYTAVSEQQVGGKAQAFVASGVKPSQPLGFTVSGKGELPRDNVTPQSSGQNAASPDATSGAAVDSRPGGGLGTPLDKDAERDPWTKYRWWILLGLAVILAAAAGIMMRSPSTPSATQQAHATASAGGALQVLRDEMFAVETDRLEGRLTDSEYAELKSAYDIVLRRALARSGPRTNADSGKVEIVPE